MAKIIEDLPNPNQSRTESYLGVIAQQPGAVLPEKPLSREEEYLEYIAEHGGGGGGEPARYLKTITKDETNQKIIIKDKNDKETEFPYGGSGGSSKKNSYASLTKIRDYVHQAVYTDIDYTKAYSFFEKMKPAANVMADDYKPTPTFEKPIGACSAFYFMGMLARMYDWNFNEQESIEVKTPAFGERYAVTGTGYNANLTKEVVESGEYSEYFDYLPFELVDGINEHGFAIAMLVVPNDCGITTGTTPEEVEDEVSMLMLPRYLLDRAIDINDAMYYLERKVSVYNVMPLIQMGYEIHYYVADKSGNHGVIEFIDNTPIFIQTEIATNFYIHGVQFNDDGTVYTPATQDADHDAMRTNFITEFGSGLERYNLINNTLKTVKSEEDIITLLMNLIYTNAYKRTTNPFWYTEFVGGKYTVATPVETYEESGGIVERAIAEYSRRDRATGTTWQTVHGGLIDCERKRIYLAFQEDLTEIYAFGFNYYTTEQIDSMIDEIGWGNLKYNQYQQLSNYEFNQVMMNLRLDARIDEYYEIEEIYTNQGIDITPTATEYTISDVEELVFNPDKEYEVPLSLGGQGTINVHGHPKGVDTLALDGSLGGVHFIMLQYYEGDIIIRFKAEDGTVVPNLTGITINELISIRNVIPINEEFIPHDDTKQDITDNSLATTAKTIPAAINEVNERVDNISPTGRFLSYWNAATGMPETNPSTIPFEYKSGDWFSISVIASEGNDNYAPTPNAYDGTPSTIQEKNAIEKGDVYRYDGTSWSWEHTATRDVQFRDILGSPFDNTALNNAFASKEDVENKSNTVNNSTEEYLTGAALLQYIVAENGGLAKQTADANTVRTTGFYTCYRSANIPSNENWGALLVIQGSNSGVSFETVQVFIPYQRSHNPWYRVWDNSADWSDWKEFALSNTSVSKTNEAYKVYGTDGNGNSTTYTVAWYLDSNIIPIRDNGGALRVGNPTMDTHAISLGYANANYQGILSEVSGYDATKTQTLKNINGQLQWIDD